MDKETYEIVNQLIEWHKGKVENLRLVIEKKDADIVLGEQTIKAGTPIHLGITIGVTIALDSFGELPIKLN